MTVLGKMIGSTIGLSTRAAASAGQQLTLAQINRDNKRNKRLSDMGIVDPYSLFAPGDSSVVSGGSSDSRAQLALAGLSSSANAGIPVVLIHEAGSKLAEAVSTSFYQGCALKISGKNPVYEPIADLPIEEMAMLLCKAMGRWNDTSEIEPYLEALGTILARRGISGYIRMLDSCPHSRMDEIIDQSEGAGSISPDEAIQLRNDAALPGIALGTMRVFLRDAVAHGKMLAGHNQIPYSKSIHDHAAHGRGALLLEVPSFGCEALISLLAADAEYALKRGAGFHLAISSSGDEIPEVLRSLTAMSGVSFTIEAPDVISQLGGESSARDTVSLAEKRFFLQHGGISAEAASRLIGEYDMIDTSIQSTRGCNIGLFGYGHSGGRSITSSKKREYIVKPEELAILDAVSGGFYLCDRRSDQVVKGTLEKPRSAFAGLLGAGR